MTHWQQLLVAGLPVDLFEPTGAPARHALLYLHGVSGRTLRDDSTFTRLLQDLRLSCVCPQGGPAWWSDRVSSALNAERHVVDVIVPWMRERLFTNSLGLLGFGMGGQGALRLGFKHPALFPAIAAIAPSIEYHELFGRGTVIDSLYDSKEQCRQDTASLHIHPSRYPPHILYTIDRADRFWYRGNDRLHEKLNALGVPHHFEPLENAGGHTWSFATHCADRVVRFLANSLEQLSRRLL